MIIFKMPSRDPYAAVPGGGPVMYITNMSSILACPRYSSYIYMIERVYGYEAELIVEEILKHGQVEMNTVLSNVLKRLQESSQGKTHLDITN